MDAMDLASQFYIRPDCIVHIGANDGREAHAYLESGARSVFYVEPIPSVFERLQTVIADMAGHQAINSVCGAESGRTVDFYVADNNGESSSLLGLGNHALIHPEVAYAGKITLTTKTVDDLFGQLPKIDLMVIDVQGAEMMVLRGAQKTLASVSSVYCEVSDIEIYDGGCTWQEILAFLGGFGFSLKDMRINTKHYGNAFFVKEGIFNASIETAGRNVAVGMPTSQSSYSQWSRPNESGLAVNGRRTGEFAFHTKHEGNPWWQVDLGSSLPLAEVLIFNRLGLCADRAYGLEILAGENLDKLKRIYSHDGRPFGGIDGTPLRVNTVGTKARYLRVQLPGEGILHLDQIEVYV